MKAKTAWCGLDVFAEEVPRPRPDLEEHFGPSYGLLAGSWHAVERADVRLSEAGALALGAEQHTVGPVPVGLVDGSLYRGGRVPRLELASALHLLQRMVAGDVPWR